jgi:hypothetical protein
MTSIREWLHAMGLGELSEEFELHRIDLDAARHLTDAEFKELGLPIGPRLKLKAAIQALTEQPRATLGSEASLQASLASSAAERRQLTVLFCDLVGSRRRRATCSTCRPWRGRGRICVEASYRSALGACRRAHRCSGDRRRGLWNLARATRFG